MPQGNSFLRWDADAQEWWVGKTLLKRFERPATLVGEVLTAFEESRWERCIKNPFKGQGDAKNLLRRSRKRLNGCQDAILFSLTGDAMHIRWEWRGA
jgi:hypothetical protein